MGDDGKPVQAGPHPLARGVDGAAHDPRRHRRGGRRRRCRSCRDLLGVEYLTLFPHLVGDPYSKAVEQMDRFANEVMPARDVTDATDAAAVGVARCCAIRERRLARCAHAGRAGRAAPDCRNRSCPRSRTATRGRRWQSLYRIATALGTTPQALFGGAVRPHRRCRHARPTTRRCPPSTPTASRCAGCCCPATRRSTSSSSSAWPPSSSSRGTTTGSRRCTCWPGRSRSRSTARSPRWPPATSSPTRPTSPHRYRSALGARARVLLVETQHEGNRQGAHSA